MYEQGFRGYTMMNGAGTGMLIPYSHVGRLALRVFNELKPLMDGPFGEGADVPFKAIGSIKLVISDRFPLARRARSLLTAAARAAGSRQRLAGCRMGEYRAFGV